MNYPSEILPKINYKFITCDLFNHYLIRFTSSNKKEDLLDSISNQIKQEHICSPREHMNDLSTSLLGVYDILHVQIELTTQGKQKFGQDWIPNEQVTAPQYLSEFIINSGRGFWVILIKKIQGIPVDYTKSNITTPFTAKCVVKHTPMKWNYWHFSIRWELDDGMYWHELQDKERAKLAKRLASEARAIIAKFAEIEEPNYSQLEKEEYCK